MNKVDAIQHFGTQQNLARALGITKSSISQWGDSIPMRRAYELERITNGALKAISPSGDKRQKAA